MKHLEIFYVIIFGFLLSSYAYAHDIYIGVHGKDSQLCCGGGPNGDCSSTIYREAGSHYEFLTREKYWVTIPENRITFLPIAGDSDEDATPNRSHLCYRAANETDRINNPENVFGDIYFYCAFIPPSGY